MTSSSTSTASESASFAALSITIPLTLVPRRAGRPHRQAWFAGLLPEGPMP